MFENLTERLTKVFKSFSGQSRFTPENMTVVLQQIRLSLLEADVALVVVTELLERIQLIALGKTVDLHLKADQALLKLIHEELKTILGNKYEPLNLKTQTPAVILMAGLQGAGKTTTAAKLAAYLQTIEKKKVMLASVDIYRPAAIEQLTVLAQQLSVPYYDGSMQLSVLRRAEEALSQAKKNYVDVLIIDTAGRLHIDQDMMDEMQKLHHCLQPIETLFVVDSMTGQDAANTAKAFHAAIPLTGVILTKTDGDARGGAALSVQMITGKPIKFMGNGERLEDLEVFHPDRVASRILGMGDVLSLIEEVERKADKKASEKLTKKITKGSGFDFEDFKQQLLQMNNMGGMAGLVSKLPGAAQLSSQAMGQMNDKSIGRTIAIINSMTPKERRFPKIIIGSRKKRIALGAGTQLQDVNRLLKQFEQMQKMIKKFSKPGGIKQMMHNIGNMPGMAGLLR